MHERPAVTMRHAAVVLSALLAACARYTPSPLNIETAPQRYAERRLDDADLRDSIRAHAPDATAGAPAALALAALFTRQDVSASVARTDAAVAAVAVADRRSAPGFDAQLERLVYGQSQGAPWLVGFAPTFHFELGGKRAARRLLAEAAVSRAAMESRLLGWSVVAEVRRADAERVLTARELRAAQVVAERARALLTHMQARAARGEVAATEVARVATEVRRFEAQVAALERMHADALAALWRVLGLRPAATLPARDDGDAWPTQCAALGDWKEASEAALRGRYEVGIALADHAAADAQVRTEVAASRPDLMLAPGFIWDQSTNRWTLGLGLPTIRFDRNAVAVRAAEARRRAAAAQVAEAQTLVLRGLDEATGRCRAAEQERTAVIARTVDAAEQLERARRRYARGEVGATDTLTAALAESEIRAVDIAAAGRVARAILELEIVAARWTVGAPTTWPTLGLPADSLMVTP